MGFASSASPPRNDRWERCHDRCCHAAQAPSPAAGAWRHHRHHDARYRLPAPAGRHRLRADLAVSGAVRRGSRRDAGSHRASRTPTACWTCSCARPTNWWHSAWTASPRAAASSPSCIRSSSRIVRCRWRPPACCRYPLVQSILPKGKRVGVLTADKDALSPDHFRAVGCPDGSAGGRHAARRHLPPQQPHRTAGRRPRGAGARGARHGRDVAAGKSRCRRHRFRMHQPAALLGEDRSRPSACRCTTSSASSNGSMRG